MKTHLSCVRRELKGKEKKNIILCRYGSLNRKENFVMTIAEISKLLGIKYSTVAGVIYRHKKQGLSALNTRKKFAKPCKTIGSPAIERELLSDAKLLAWAHLSTRARALKV